jgi:D-tyrosyl-tRNA(Tyr) deacylase
MRFVIQVARNANVTVDEERDGKIESHVNGEIDYGFVVLIGVGHDDTEEIADKMVKKLLGMRIFPDSDGKTNLSLAQVDGQLLLISQFTLYANCRKGNRPSFTDAAAPEEANRLYEYVVSKCREQVSHVETGVFGGDMHVTLTNEGPFTIILDSRDLN